ncbi:putative protein TPRXL [Mizuhopecten yessoensis]|uniref:putative protein TPRXL n=1 Tax=Mizuhopecten yessoensis TaxID=6573 RepID=UPI000B457812|nr:putative protein TPRXL [Mizuhopecten yessoensis]
MNVFGVTLVTRPLCLLVVVLTIFGHVSESVPLWNTGSDSNTVPVPPNRINSSLVYRWLIRLMSRKDLYSWINFHVHPHLTPMSMKKGPTTPVTELSDGELQIQRDTDDFGTVPFVSSGSSNEGDATTSGPALIVVRDVDDTSTTHPFTQLSTASIVQNGIPMIILSGNKNVDRIGDDSKSTTADDSSTPQMIRDTFDDTPVAGVTMSPAGEGDNPNMPSVPVIVDPAGSTDDGSNSNSDTTDNPDTPLTIVRDKDGESETQTSNNDSPASSSSSPTSQSTSSSSGSTSSGLLMLNPADMLNHGFGK